MSTSANMPGQPGDVRIYSKCSLALLVVVLSVSMAAMGSSIVIESSSFPSNQWLLIVLYTTFFDFNFFLTLVLYYRMPLRDIVHELTKWRQYMMIGMLWSMNYVFILLSAPYLSNVIQVVLAQIQSVIIAFIDWRYIGIIITTRKWVCIFLVVALSGISVVFEAQSSDNAIGSTVFWSAVFAFNSFCGGLASLATEALLKVKRERRLTQLVVQDDSDYRPSGHSGRGRGGSGEYACAPPEFNAAQEVVLLNFASNFYGILFGFLGIPIALYSLRSPPPGTDQLSAMELVNFSIFQSHYIWYWVLMVFSSFVYTIASGLLQVDQSALYNAICSSFGSCLQLCFFLLPTEFQQPFDKYSFSFALALTVVSAFYILTSDKRDMHKLMASAIGEYYNNTLSNTRQPLSLPLLVLAVYIAVNIAAAAMWGAGQ